MTKMKPATPLSVKYTRHCFSHAEEHLFFPDASKACTITLQSNAFRRLARAFEREGHYRGEEFTCITVARMLGYATRTDYADAFELEFCRVPTLNAEELWDMEDDERRDVRVLMLCFAAAMAEKGDL